MSFRQIDNASIYPVAMKTLSKGVSRILAGEIGIECNKDGPVRPVGQLRKLFMCQMDSKGATGIYKTRLPKNRQIEQAFYQNHIGIISDYAPCEQAALGARKKSVGKSSAANAASIKIDRATPIKARKHDAAIEGILALMHKSELQQQFDRISQPGHVAIKHSSGGVSDGELFDQFGVMHSAAVKAIDCLGMAAELLLIKVDRFCKSFIVSKLRLAELLLQMGKSFMEREIQGKLDKADEVAAPAAAVAIEKILCGIDVEGRVILRMQGTQTDELLASSDGARRPVMLP